MAKLELFFTFTLCNFTYNMAAALIVLIYDAISTLPIPRETRDTQSRWMLKTDTILDFVLCGAAKQILRVYAAASCIRHCVY